MTTTPTLTALAAAVEAGLAQAETESGELSVATGLGIPMVSEEIFNAQAAFAEYRRRVDKLEAALEPWKQSYKGYLSYIANNRWGGDFLDYLTMFEGRDKVDDYGIRALLADSADAAHTEEVDGGK